MNCLSCDAALEKVHGQSHHWCRDCNRYEFPTDLGEGEVSTEGVPISNTLSARFLWILDPSLIRLRSVFVTTAEVL